MQKAQEMNEDKKELILRVRDRLARSHRVEDIARDYGIAKSTIYTWAIKYNFPVKKLKTRVVFRKTKKIPDSETLREMIKNAREIQDVADAIGITAQSLYNHISKLRRRGVYVR